MTTYTGEGFTKMVEGRVEGHASQPTRSEKEPKIFHLPIPTTKK